MARMALTGFGDEISNDFVQQLTFMKALGINAIELRNVDGTNIIELDDAQIERVKRLLGEYGMRVSAIGSPIGKTGIDEDFAASFDAFKRTVEIAQKLGAGYIRMFSYYIPQGKRSEGYTAAVLERLGKLKACCAGSGVVMLHENEGGIFGESPENCKLLADELCDDTFALIFDPSNFVQHGHDAWNAWLLLRDKVKYMHIKDSVALSDAERASKTNPHRVAGTGECRIADIIADLKARGYSGYLSIEPHLFRSAHVSGTRFGKWAAAALALQGILDTQSIEWEEEQNG